MYNNHITFIVVNLPLLLSVSECVLHLQIFGFLVMGVYGLNTYLAVRRWRLGDSRDGPLQTSEYIRARTASRGEVESRPELQ